MEAAARIFSSSVTRGIYNSCCSRRFLKLSLTARRAPEIAKSERMWPRRHYSVALQPQEKNIHQI